MRKSPSDRPFTNSKFLKPYTLKPTVFPPDFCLIVDTREQASPLFVQKPPKGLMVMRDTCKVGDYMVRSMENFSIEKKYYGDLFSYCTTEWEGKTKRKLEQMKSIISNGGWCGLLIDNRESDIFKWQEHTSIHPESVRGALNSIRMRYGVHVYFSPSKEHSMRFILDSAVKWYNIQHEL